MKRLAVLFHAVTQVGFVEHVEGRPLLAGKVDHVDAADEQMTITHLGRLGKHCPKLHGDTAVRLFGQIRFRERHTSPSMRTIRPISCLFAYNNRGCMSKGFQMGKPEPSMDQWLAEAKASENADKCGMFLTHNGIVRSTAKAQVRKGEEMPAVAQVDFSYDAAGVEAAVAEALTWDGVYYVKVWLNEGVLEVGESIMYVLIGADIRPRCIDALQNLVGKIKNELVVEKEIYA